MSEEVTTKDKFQEEEEGPVIELGDRIRLLGGKHDKTSGRVIYRSADEIHLMPDGLNNTAIEFPITEDGFNPEAGVESVEILSKRKKPGLIDILNLNVDQILQTFNSSGEPISEYTIVKLIPEEDTIIVKSDEEGEVTLPFGYIGIPKGLGFSVIRSRQPEVVKIEEVQEESDVVDNEEEATETLEDFAFLDEELEVPAEEIEYLVEIPTADRVYTTVEQKSEAYADLLSLNTLPMQKLATTQKSMKVLTELFFQLRSSILNTSDSGRPLGIKPSTVQDLIDILETRLISLSRPIIDADKILYHDMDESKDPEPYSIYGVKLYNFNNKIDNSITYLDTSTDMVGKKFISFLNGYLNRYTGTWIPNSEPRIAFQTDEEVFRRKAPDTEASIPGYARGLPTYKKGRISSEDVAEVSMSLLRGLKPTRTKTQLLQSGEEAAVLGYVLFPLLYADSLSTARLESLTADIEAGLSGIQTMKDILPKGDEITDIPSPSQPFLVSVDGGTLGNIPLREYLKSVNLKIEGMGDVWRLQTMLGMREKEWTIDQDEVLKEAITITQNQIISEIDRQREALAQLVSQPPAVQGIQMNPNGPAMIEKLAGEPYLLEIQKHIKEQMPSFANSDVTLVGLLLRHHPEMAFAQLADQGSACAPDCCGLNFLEIL